MFATISLFASAQESAAGYAEAIKMINAAITDCYLIFSGMLITRVIVEEYLKKTVTILLTYSVSRYRLMAAKVLFVLGMTICLMSVTGLVSLVYLVAAGPYMKLSLGVFGEADFMCWLVQFGWSVILTVTFTLMSMSVAFIKKTSQSVFVSSLLAIIIVQILISQDIQGFSLVFGLISIVLTGISIKKYADKIE